MLTVFSQVRSISSNIAGGIQPIQVRFNCMITKLSYHVIILESKSAKVRWRWKEIWVGQALDHQRIWQWVQFSHYDCICVVTGVVVMIDWPLFLTFTYRFGAGASEDCWEVLCGGWGESVYTATDTELCIPSGDNGRRLSCPSSE